MFGWRRRKLTSELPQDVVTIIAAETKICGERLHVETDLRVDGKLEADVIAQGRFVVGEEGTVRGDVVARDMVIGGRVTGKILVDGSLTLLATAVVHGSIEAGRLAIDEGATGRFATSITTGTPAAETDPIRPDTDVEWRSEHSGDGVLDGDTTGADTISMNPSRARSSTVVDRAPTIHDERDQGDRSELEVSRAPQQRDRFW